MEWFQNKMDLKYAMKMQSLKRSLIFFYNLADQVISLYNLIRVKMEKYNDKEEYNDITAILNRSLIIIAKIVDKMPTCLDSYFCEKFIKSFDLNINLLCTLYHSLNHYDIISTYTFSKTKRTSLRRRRQSKESTKCTLSMSKSRTYTKIIQKSRRPSHSYRITTKSSKPKSTQSLKNSKSGNNPVSSILKILKPKPWSSTKVSSKRYRASTKSLRPKVLDRVCRIAYASVLSAHSPTLLSPGPTRTSSLVRHQSLQRDQRKKEEHLLHWARELQPADALDKRHLQAQYFFEEY